MKKQREESIYCLCKHFAAFHEQAKYEKKPTLASLVPVASYGMDAEETGRIKSAPLCQTTLLLIRFSCIKSKREVIDMWSWLEKNHPVAYEIVQWSVLGVAVAALINECL